MISKKMQALELFHNDLYVNYDSFSSYIDGWTSAKPFSHIVLDDFLKDDVISDVVREFPDYESDIWRVYNNPIEIKKLCNHWDKFGPATYRLFQYLNSKEFIDKLEPLVGCRLYPDYGLNGGGLHSHKRGGKLNAHLDYSIHPKLKLERRINLLIYVTPGWNNLWGGSVGLWKKMDGKSAPSELIKQISPLFNRAIMFDTTQDSWHGLPVPIDCPEGICRNSLAIYYLCEPRISADERGKALFAPYENQAEDPEILKLIERRSDVNQAKDVYGDK